MADHVGQVLVQGAAEGHVQDLHAPADCQNRQSPLDRGAGQTDLRLVALGVNPVHRRVGLLPVPLRVDVAPAGEEEPGERRQRIRRVAPAEPGQHEAVAAGAPDALDVQLGHAVTAQLPSPDAAGLEVVGGDGDEGLNHGREK